MDHTLGADDAYKSRNQNTKAVSPCDFETLDFAILAGRSSFLVTQASHLGLAIILIVSERTRRARRSNK